MKPVFRFRLRTLIILVGILSVFFAIGANYHATRRTQMRNVQKLEELGGLFHARQGAYHKIQVWYDDDLQWNEDEKRYEIALSFFVERTGVKQWICDRFGRDFAYSPIALEIDCHAFDKSTLTQEIIDQIRTLPTIRQVWIKEWVNRYGEQTNETTNDDLRNIFPDLIVASPQ